MTRISLLFVASFAVSPLAAQDQPKALPAGYTVQTIATPEGVAFGVFQLSHGPEHAVPRIGGRCDGDEDLRSRLGPDCEYFICRRSTRCAVRIHG